MGKNTKIKTLKTAFWIGAITDGLAAIIMMFPELSKYVFGSENFEIVHEYRYALGMAAIYVSFQNHT